MKQAYFVKMFALTIALSAFVPAYAQNGEQQPAPSPSPAVTVAPPSSSPGDSTGLILIKNPKPSYPMEAANKGIQGQVWIHLLISETGDVESADIISGDPDLARAAQETMKKWKFKPYIRDGKAVKVSIKMSFDFAFKDKVTDSIPPDSSTKTASSADASKPSEGASGVQPSTNLPQKLRVSSAVAQGLLLHDVQPVYPLEAKQHHIQGDVILRATIGKDGLVHSLKEVSGHPVLVEAAKGAVEQWRYRPYLLQGNPVEVETTIKIVFHL